VELRDLEAYGEPGAVVYLADCVELMRLMPVGSVDVIFADPPYRLSSGGVTVRSGRLAPVDKGSWDRSKGFHMHYGTCSCDHRTYCGWGIGTGEPEGGLRMSDGADARSMLDLNFWEHIFHALR
jgi:hypothetical protein